MTAKKIQSIQSSAELPVDQLYNQALTGLMNTHAELAKLPHDKSDPLEPLEGIMRDLGVDMGTDYSMFLMGAMGNVGLEAGMHALGIAANSGMLMGMDVATSMLMDSADKESRGATPALTGASSKSVFTAATKFRRANDPAPKKAPVHFATSMMRNALTRPGQASMKHAANKRKSLRRQMETHKENIRELHAFKSCGVKYARRVTVPNGATGESESYLVASADKPNVALNNKGARIDVSLCQKPGYKAPSFGMVA